MNAEPNIPPRPSYRLERELPNSGAVAGLKSLRGWMTWAYDWNGTRWTKPPRSGHTGQKAGSTDESAWATYYVARETQKRHGLAGVGFSLDADPDLIGIDLDHCLDAEGQPEDWASEILDLAETYAEVSPSGRGLRFLARGLLPAAIKNDASGVEIYASGRYLTLTGDHVAGMPDEIRPAPKMLAKLVERVEATKRRASEEKAKAERKPQFKIDTGDDFFASVKVAALAHLDRWVPVLFPRAAFQPGTGAWRVSSRDLGRDLEEDLSIAPSGIQDFGEEHGLNPIQVVEKWGGAPSGIEAALWLCGKIGIDPAALGYQDWGDGSKAAHDDNEDTSPADHWDQPDPKYLRTMLPEPPPLPLDDIFSPAWARWIRTAAEAKSAPVDYVVAGLLGVAGSLIGNTRWAAPWAGWTEPPVIWTMLVGNPSAGKSPGLDAILGPQRAIEREVRQSAKAEHEEWKAGAEIAKMFEGAWKEAAKKSIAEGREVPKRPPEADPGPEPFLPRLAVSDATIEKMIAIAAKQPRGVLLARDELSGWLGNMSRYSGGNDRPFWLEGFGGRPYSVERVGRDQIHVERLTISIIGGIQPDRLKALLFATDDDGLLARFLPVWPHPAPIKRPVTDADTDFIETALRRLLSLRMVEEDDDGARPYLIRFAEKTREMLVAFRVQCREWEEGQEGLLLSFIGKLPGLAVRLSLVLAYLDVAGGDVDPAEIEPIHFGRALDFIELYALPMARRAYADGSLPKQVKAGKKLAAVIIEQGWTTFTTSQVLLLDRPGLLTKAELDPALEALELGNLIRAEATRSGPKGGRPSRRYSVNPKLGG